MLAEFVKWREIDGSVGGAVVLSSDDHPMTPPNRFTVWHTLDDAKSFVA